MAVINIFRIICYVPELILLPKWTWRRLAYKWIRNPLETIGVKI